MTRDARVIDEFLEDVIGAIERLAADHGLMIAERADALARLTWKVETLSLEARNGEIAARAMRGAK